MLPPSSRHGFFNTFPREIRDNIYDMLYDEINRDTYSTALTLRTPVVSLRLVSRQCKDEYDDWVAQNERMTAFEVWDSAGMDTIKSTRASVYTHTTNATIHLFVCGGDHLDYPCYHTDILRSYAMWIRVLVNRMLSLRSIRVSLAINYDHCMDAVKASLGLITNLSKVVEVKMRHVNHRDRSILPRETSDLPVVAVWTKESGLVRDHEAIKRCREIDLMLERKP